MKQLTVGIYVINPSGRLLVCHPTETSQSNWGIPKGLPDGNETLMETGLRELNEEAGIDIKGKIKDLKYVGIQTYKDRPKTLVAFTVTLDDHIRIESLYCNSLFESLYGSGMTPEIDDYKWINFNASRNDIHSVQAKLWDRYLKEVMTT